MRISIHHTLVASLLMATLAIAQQDLILPTQIKAIMSLAAGAGFTEEELSDYVVQTRGVPLEKLKQQQGAALILMFQSDNPPSPLAIRRSAATTPARAQVGDTQKAAEPEELLIAENLDVGMSKRFHLIDGNVIEGIIVRIEGEVAHIEAIHGLLRVPTRSILEETAHITLKNDTRFIGPVLKETTDEIILRSTYGDVVISKRDIREMDRYHGGRHVPWAEEKKKFYRGEAALTEIFANPTAFPLAANTFYLDGYSIGYGFTDRLMIQTSFADDFTDDLNLHPTIRLYHRQTGTSEVAAAVGFHVFSRHPVTSTLAPYGQYIRNTARGDSTIDQTGESMDTVLPDPKDRIFFGKAYIVLSSRRSLATGRGRMGWHIGLMTNSLIIEQPALDTTYTWDDDWLFGSKLPFRAWAAFEYDLTKRIKVMITMWADNGYKYNTVSETLNDYWSGDTPGKLDSAEGEYRMVDFDFGLLFALRETFRVGFHFQKPYFILYWEVFQL